MFDLDPDVCAMFYKKNDLTAEEITVSEGFFIIIPLNFFFFFHFVFSCFLQNQTGIRQLAHGAHIHDHLFEPCGYSMNAQLEESYFTIHVTPESHCSYASFATNHCVTSYESTLKQVIAVFRPKRFTMTLFADEGAALEIDDPCFLRKIDVPCRSTKLCYTKSSMTQTQVSISFICFVFFVVVVLFICFGLPIQLKISLFCSLKADTCAPWPILSLWKNAPILHLDLNYFLLPSILFFFFGCLSAVFVLFIVLATSSPFTSLP